jgi:hypothetical protein
MAASPLPASICRLVWVSEAAEGVDELKDVGDSFAAAVKICRRHYMFVTKQKKGFPGTTRTIAATFIISLFFLIFAQSRAVLFSESACVFWTTRLQK